MPNLLIEIGTEELPLASLDVLYAHLAHKAGQVLEKNRVSHGEIKMEATPRRIALFVSTVALRQEDQQLELSGPSFEKAYGPAGEPTPALLGFLRSKNLELKDVQVKETPKGKFVSAVQKISGKPVLTLLEALIGEIFGTLPFPKMMRWDATGFRFPRPIRWLVVLFDKKIVPVRIADIKAANQSFGHRFLAPKAFKLIAADWKGYLALLKRAHVTLGLEERKELIRTALKKQFHQKHFDEELVHITAQLVEEPFLIEGTFSKTYLELPAEVLASCMKKNQKIFATLDSRGQMQNRFVAVLNGRRGNLSRIRFDYENVLESRLRDARYFFVADNKEPLETKLPLLEQLVYLGKLGTMREKTVRLEKLARQFSDLIARHDLSEHLERAAKLSKIDLMTHMVYEFPDLQGIMGREYALEQNENVEVAYAIGAQYLPKNLTQDYRELKKEIRPLGALFGIMDRMDLLVGAFGTGIIPTGSQDPYALRRAGGAIVKLVRAFGFHFSLSEFIQANVSLYGQALQTDLETLKKQLKGFLEERVFFELGVKPGTRPYEILQAVLKVSSDDLANVYLRFQELETLWKDDPDSFHKAAKVVERTSNILKSADLEVLKGVQLTQDCLETRIEKELWDFYTRYRDSIEENKRKRQYGEAMLHYGRIFSGLIHELFEQVMINAEDPVVRRNRQALLFKINRLFVDDLADVSLLTKLE